MFIDLPIVDRMDYSDGIDTRMKLYMDNPDLGVFMAEDVHFGCMYLLLTVKQATEGKGNIGKLVKANAIFDRLTRGAVADHPDSDQPGLSYEELDELSSMCQGWFEIFEKVIASTDVDVDSATLWDILQREAEYHNCKANRESFEDRRFYAEPIPFDFN